MVQLIQKESPERTFDIWLKSANPPAFPPKELLPKGSAVPNTSVRDEYIKMHLEHLNMFMERARNYNEVQPQTTHTQNHLCILLILKRACVLFSEWGGGVGDVAWPFNFPWHFTKTWKAEVLFNLTYASDQLIKGVSWRTVNQNCARVVLKLRRYAA